MQRSQSTGSAFIWAMPQARPVMGMGCQYASNLGGNRSLTNFLFFDFNMDVNYGSPVLFLLDDVNMDQL